MVHKEPENLHGYEKRQREAMKIGQNLKRGEKNPKHGKGEVVLEAQNLKRASYDLRTVKADQFGENIIHQAILPVGFRISQS